MNYHFTDWFILNAYCRSVDGMTSHECNVCNKVYISTIIFLTSHIQFCKIIKTKPKIERNGNVCSTAVEGTHAFGGSVRRNQFKWNWNLYSRVREISEPILLRYQIDLLLNPRESIDWNIYFMFTFFTFETFIKIDNNGT